MTHLVQSSAHVDWRRLDDIVDDLRERCQEVRRVDFGVEEDLGSKEAFVADVHRVILQQGISDEVVGLLVLYSRVL